MVQQFFNLFRGQIARGATGAFGLHVTEAGVGFVTAVVLARVLGTAEYGAYAFAISLAGFLTIPALFGYNTLAVKEIAALSAVRNWSSLRAFLSGALIRVLLSASLVIIAGFVLLTHEAINLAPNMRAAALVSLALVLLNTIVRLYEGFLSGIGRVVIAKVPDKAFRPIIFLFLALGTYLSFVGLEQGVYAVVLNVLATGLGLLLLLTLWYRYHPIEIGRSPSVRNTENQGFRQALYFALIAGVSVLNAQADVLMLGFMSSADNVGVYRIASRVASLVIFALIAVGASLAPRISALYTKGDHSELQSLAFKGALATSVIGLPIALVLIFVGDWILLLFGRDFQAGAVALSLLSIGHLINAFVGIVAVLLSMTGHEQKLAKIFAIAALLNVLLNAVLIPLYGVVGAASATAVSGILLNLSLAFVAYRVLGVNPTVFGAVIWLLRSRK